MIGKSKIFIAFAFIFTLIFSATTVSADYQRKADNTVAAYHDEGLTNRTGNERVDAGDLVTVHRETSRAYYVTYPTPKGYKTRWVPKNVFNSGGGGSDFAYPLGRAISSGNGHDYSAGEGTPVYAIQSGTMNCYQIMGEYAGRAYNTVSYGNLIELQCDNGALAKYAHLSRFEGVGLRYNGTQNTGSTWSNCRNRSKIHVGSRRVNKGDVIGYVGSTGNSTGPHLHFELYINGQKQSINNYFSR